jgi:hypothetical protein
MSNADLKFQRVLNLQARLSRREFLGAVPTFRAGGISGNQFPEAFHVLAEKCPELLVDGIQFFRLGNAYRPITQRANPVFQAPRHDVGRNKTAENARGRSFLMFHSLT